MRVIAGIAKGHKLRAVPGRDTRPLADRVKESLFSILAPRLEGARVLDLYSGTGAFAIEAVSRGADAAVCVDISRVAVQVARQNVEKVGFSRSIEVRRADTVGFARMLAAEERRFDLVFADPPFKDVGEDDSPFDRLTPFLGKVCGAEGIVVIRVHRKAPSPEIEGMELYRRHPVGISHLLFYRPLEVK